ncbi:hypothetical protein TTRE_0000822601 [Trichuris trichiura]|uniref:Uncharacterized protein n=1 Tax=Trichuris trichiura TaxID=36087 RepID=A0A077ZHM5_TRITR|nr:hypothetical protein TTRE_0000822601 [Trichuris trichiura]
MSDPTPSDNMPSTSQSRVKVASTSRRLRNMQSKSIEWLHQTVPDEKAAVQFLRGKGLLHSERLCPSCGQRMRPGRGGMTWSCFKRSCRKDGSVCTGTWFGGKCTNSAAAF